MTELTFLQQNLAPVCQLKYNEPISQHTSFRIGGPAEVMAFPKSRQELADLFSAAKALGIAPVILGAGTNVLAPDEGIQGIVVCLKDALDGMELLEGDRIRVMAGVSMTRAAVFAANHSLSGLEFAHGIPGTVGGGVYMNAGAYGGEISHVCESVEFLDRSGNFVAFTKEEMAFSYRHSVLEDNGGIVVSAVFQLTPAPQDSIRERMKELMAKRSASQPLELPSAGSAFKRPVGGFAGALIEQAGLKGFQIGAAAISTKHAGFAVNLGGATAADVKALLAAVSDKVFENSGIRLEPEVRIW